MLVPRQRRRRARLVIRVQRQARHDLLCLVDAAVVRQPARQTRQCWHHAVRAAVRMQRRAPTRRLWQVEHGKHLQHCRDGGDAEHQPPRQRRVREPKVQNVRQRLQQQTALR
jgi:hypothetical protein